MAEELRRGYTCYHCERGITLSKASLGRFFYTLLKLNGQTFQVWPFAPQYERSSVIASIGIKSEDKDTLEREAGVVLRDPPQVHLNG